jgi:hypothetical protein
VNNNRRDHLSFLLRLWRVEAKPAAVWRASLEDPKTGRRKGFANPNALMQFLRSLTDEIEFTGEENEQDFHFPPNL